MAPLAVVRVCAPITFGRSMLFGDRVKGMCPRAQLLFQEVVTLRQFVGVHIGGHRLVAVALLGQGFVFEHDLLNQRVEVTLHAFESGSGFGAHQYLRYSPQFGQR